MNSSEDPKMIEGRHAQHRYEVPDPARRIDASCDRFEAEWRAGRRPRIEDHLGALDGPRRTGLLRELLMLELELAREAGASPAAESYHARFVGDAAVIDAVFGPGEGRDRADPQGGGRERTEPSPGQLIGRYIVLSRLDEGGEAVVYRVLHAELIKPFVLKLSRRPASSGDRLAAQARLLAELDHPRLVQVVDLDLYEDRPYLVMEYVAGLNLKQYAEQHRPTPRRAAAMVAELAGTVAFLHRRGVIHQDIKPRNVLVDEAGRTRLIDFGQARLRHAWAAPCDGEGSSGGTLAYMSPEQADSRDGRISTRTDIFGLGAVLYELLTGRPPYRAATSAETRQLARHGLVIPPRQFDPGIPRALESICLRAMAHDPADRHSFAEELERDLRQFARRAALLAPLAAMVGLIRALAARAVATRDRPQPAGADDLIPATARS